MANIPIYDGNPIWSPEGTPFGFYDSDTAFQQDSVKVAKFCAQRLGYPLVDVELQSGSFFTAFEEAVTTYGNELYAYAIRDNQLSLIGGNSSTPSLNNAVVTPTFEPIVSLTEQYGSEAGSGGNVPYYTGSIPLTQSIQDYDLKQWAIDEGVSGEFGIEIKRVFYENTPAVTRIFDPVVGGAGANGALGSFGFAGVTPGASFLMMPLSLDLQIVQAIELNDHIRRSQYSFEIKNNDLRIFPIPTHNDGHLRFEYIKRDERVASSVQATSNTITNVSNSPYTNPNYTEINSVGRSWIFEYALALSKEMLGYVRGKYSNIPIPNAELTLNQSDLLSAATAEKVALIEKLRLYLDETSRKSLLERRSQESEFIQTELKQVPYTIYVG